MLQLARNNCERNMLCGNLPGLGTSTHVSYEQFLWNSSPAPRGPGGRWDLVLGSDVTYEFDEDAHASLAATLSTLLRQDSEGETVHFDLFGLRVHRPSCGSTADDDSAAASGSDPTAAVLGIRQKKHQG